MQDVIKQVLEDINFVESTDFNMLKDDPVFIAKLVDFLNKHPLSQRQMKRLRNAFGLQKGWQLYKMHGELYDGLTLLDKTLTERKKEEIARTVKGTLALLFLVISVIVGTAHFFGLI